MNAKTHYKNHLSHFYTWMFGDFNEMVERQKKFFQDHHVSPSKTQLAIDLGAGSGFQSIALAELGFKVVSVDFSEELLNELKNKKPEIPVRCQDIRDLSFAKELSPELIVCMGDTLTHLSSKEDVAKLVNDIYSVLTKNGKVIFTYRNLENFNSDLDRFIPVKSDDDRILTCVLEDVHDQMKVTDLLYEKIDGRWNLKKSSYMKIKIAPTWLKSIMEDLGFEISQSRLPSGMEVFIGLKKY